MRANAIEVLEGRMQEAYVPILATRARSSHNRERANAIKALCRMKVTTATSQLMNMLKGTIAATDGICHSKYLVTAN